MADYGSGYAVMGKYRGRIRGHCRHQEVAGRADLARAREGAPDRSRESAKSANRAAGRGAATAGVHPRCHRTAAARHGFCRYPLRCDGQPDCDLRRRRQRQVADADRQCDEPAGCHDAEPLRR